MRDTMLAPMTRPLPLKRMSQLALTCAFLAMVGCQATPTPPTGQGPSPVRPTIAVLMFENQTASPWDVGAATREILTDRLQQSDQYQVVARPELESFMREISLAHTDKSARATGAQLKNVQYLFKGTVADFAPGSGSTSSASIAVNLELIDAQSGKVIASQQIHESIALGSTDYHALAAGAFAQSPLGQATARAMDAAIAKIGDRLAQTPWQPKVALVTRNQLVYLLGGTQRGLKVGQEFAVAAPAGATLDSGTGDVIVEKRSLGHIKVVSVDATSATAVVVDGTGQIPVGAVCEYVGNPAAAPAGLTLRTARVNAGSNDVAGLLP